MLSRSQSVIFEDGSIVPTNESGYKYFHDQFMKISEHIKFLEEVNQSKPKPRRTQRIQKAKAEREYYRNEWYWYLRNIIDQFN